MARVSHHKRSGWTSPFSAAWINLRAMFVYGAEFFMLKPGVVLLIVGLLLSLPLSFGSLVIGGVTFGLYWMLVGVTLGHHRSAELLLRVPGSGFLRLHGHGQGQMGANVSLHPNRLDQHGYISSTGIGFEIVCLAGISPTGGASPRHPRCWTISPSPASCS